MYKIIDSHMHTYPDAIAARAAENLGKFYNFIVSRSGTESDLLECARETKLSGFLLLPVATSVKNVDKINEASAESVRIARENGFEAYSFGCMHRDYPDFKVGLEKCISLGLGGIKLHPDLQREDVDSDRMFSLYELMEKMGLILYLHVGDERKEMDFSSPDRVASVAKTFPKLKIVAAHLGGYRQWEKAERVLFGKYDNLYYDCSTTFENMCPKKEKYIFEKCGLDRVFFGSDYPAVSPMDSFAGFMRLDFSEEIRQDILYNNFVREIVRNGEKI